MKETLVSPEYSPREIVEKLSNKFPNGASLVFLDGKQHKKFQKQGKIVVQDSYQQNLRDLNFDQEEGRNSRSAFTDFFSGKKGSVAISMDFDLQFTFQNSIYAANILTETSKEDDSREEKGGSKEGKKQYATKHPNEFLAPAILLIGKKFESPKTDEKPYFEVKSSEMVSVLTHENSDLVELYADMNNKTQKTYDEHIKYMRETYPSLKDEPEDKVENASPYLHSGLYESDAMQDFFDEYLDGKIKEWLISLAL